MNKIYLGSVNISTAKLGSGDTVMYIGGNKVYPYDQPTPPVQTCYDVTDNISTYTGTTFEDVYDKSQQKWYKLNNLSQYEEYGVMGSGRSITYYEGKLTVDDGYEYQYSGSSWVNVGAVTGTSASLPDVTFSINYNAKDYDSSTSAFTKTSGQVIDHNPVVSGNAITVSSDHITVTGNSRAVIPSTYKSYLNRDSNNPNITVICKARTTKSGEGNILANRGSNYNWMYRQYTASVTLHGTSQSFATLTFTDDGNPKICSTRVDSSRNLILNNWTDGISSSGTGFTYGSTNNDGAALFCGYSTTSNEYWGGDFYWVYMSQETLTDEQVQQVINYNEGGSSLIYPVDYSEMQAPPTQVVFSSVSEMEAYECVYDGLIGIVGNDAYVYTNGEWVAATAETRYLHLEVLDDNFTFKCTQPVSYSINSLVWTSLAANTDSPAFNSGDTIYLKGENTTGETFITTGRFKAAGYPCSMVYGDSFTQNLSSVTTSGFTGMFSGCTGLTDASGLTLPATTLFQSCYRKMFQNCTSLTTAPSLPATTLAEYCYDNMFAGCTSLLTAPSLPATTLYTANYCYMNMFRGCTSLTTAPALPATTLTTQCYMNMFYGCSRLATAPELPATTLAHMCYREMFTNCTSLTAAPALPATTLTIACYYMMFGGCTSLTTAPTLSATTLANGCYQHMFEGCTSLTIAPTLPATTLADNCYAYMFRGCSRLTTAPALPATTLATRCYDNMFTNCTSLTTAPVLSAATLANYCYNFMFADCTGLTTAPDLPATTLAEGCYYGLFTRCRGLTTIPNNYLPLTTLEKSCYQEMFYSCSRLATAPELPATTLAQSCYNQMFRGCSSLTTAPALPATTLAQSCYMQMFNGCTSLTTAPTLPATTLADMCYQSMFTNCTSLTTAPELPATTLVQFCYSNMFNGCTHLNRITCLATNISASYCTSSWVGNVAANGTFTKDPSMTSWTSGSNGIPSGWTVQDYQ